MTASVVVERDAPLSRSLLWDLQRAWYERAGVTPWSEDVVPHYITTNPTMAAAIARVIEGWLRDGALADPAEPLTLLELGAGTGRLAWHVVAELDALAARGLLPRFRYVLSDISPRTVAWWRAHPQLGPLLARGVVDVARVDAEAEGAAAAAPVVLEVSGARLERLANPLVVIATYLFDSLRTDAFVVRGGQLLEQRLTLTAPEGHPPVGDPDLIGVVERSWTEVPVAPGRYPEPELDALLGSYVGAAGPVGATRGDGASADGDAAFGVPMPIAALRCLRRLERAAGGRMLLVAADKGFTAPSAMRGRVTPDLVVHGSISSAVNLHAVLEDARRRGATAMATPPGLLRLATIAIAHGAARTDELRAAFDAAFGQSGPDDWYALKRVIERRYGDCALDELLALLRVSRGDANVLRGCAHALFERIAGADDAARAEVPAVIERIERGYYWVGEAADVPFLCGIARHLAGDRDGARAALERAIALHDRAPRPCRRLIFGGMWVGEDDDSPAGLRVRALEADPLYRAASERLLTLPPDDPAHR